MTPPEFLRLRDAVNVPDELERDDIVRRIRRARALAVQNKNDIEHWNRTHPNEPAIDTTDEDELIAYCDGVGPMPRALRERLDGHGG